MVDFVINDPDLRKKRIEEEREEFYKEKKNKKKSFPTEPPHRSVLHWKTLQHPVTFANQTLMGQQYLRWGLQENDLHMVIAHARAATQGKIIKENSHPFHVGHLLGVHNGTVTGTFKNREKYDTDSEAIYHNILEMGVEAALKGIDTDATTLAYALVWLDTKDKTINIIRNNMRPLHMFEQAGTIFFSSEQKDLAYTFNRTMIEVKQFEAGYLYTMDILEGKGFEKKKVDVTRTYNSYHYNSAAQNRWMGGAVVDAEYSDDWGEYGVSSYPPVNNNVRQRNTPLLPFHPNGNLRQVADAIREDKRIKDMYNERFKMHSLTQMSNLANTDYHSIRNSRFELLFNRYFSETLWQVWCIWKKDHKEEYTKELNKMWDALDQDTKNKLLMKVDKGDLPDELSVSKDNNLVWLRDRDKRENDSTTDLIIPYGTQGKKCSMLAFHQKTRDGCTFCGDPVSIDERLFWVNERDFLCDKCQYEAYHHEDHLIHQTFDTTNLESFVNDVTSDDALPDHNTISNIAM